MTKLRVVIGLTLKSDWLRMWREFSRPITELSEGKSMESWTLLDTHAKRKGSFHIRSARSRSRRVIQSSENQTDGIRRKINWIVAVVRLWMA